jgi:hypothetical protein
MPGERRVFCNLCRRETRHDIVHAFEQVLDANQIVQWQIIQCRGCESISFYESRSINIDLAEPLIINRIYPPRMIHQIKQFDGIPERLERIYKEMMGAFNGESHILCAAGLRALVEGICAGQNITDGPKRNQETGEYEINSKNHQVKRGKTLDCKIEGLAEGHLLTETEARALHQHRYLGNSALHELEVPSSERLSIAIDIVEHAMETLYNIPIQAGNLSRMRVDTR